VTHPSNRSLRTEEVTTLEPDPTLPAPEIAEDSPISDQTLPARPRLHAPTDNVATDNAFSPAAFFSSLLKQLYLDQNYVPRTVLVPVDFPDRGRPRRAAHRAHRHRIEILAPQRGEKRSLVDLVCLNAKQSYDQRFRVLQPGMKAIQAALQDLLTLEEPPRRIECFDISHIQGAETVASMVVWENGAMKKSDYRKFQVRTVTGVDDFASMREVVARRYKRILVGEGKDAGKMPSSSSSTAASASSTPPPKPSPSSASSPARPTSPLASIAKREEIIYVHGQESDPIVLDRRSPVLHLIQKIRDESHRFAVTYHRKRREIRDRDSELDAIPGVGPRTRQRLLEHFGSLRAIRHATPDALTAVVSAATAAKIRRYFEAEAAEPNPLHILA
jgi:excinuclease ABC subunit C